MKKSEIMLNAINSMSENKKSMLSYTEGIRVSLYLARESRKHISNLLGSIKAEIRLLQSVNDNRLHSNRIRLLVLSSNSLRDVLRTINADIDTYVFNLQGFYRDRPDLFQQKVIATYDQFYEQAKAEEERAELSAQQIN